MNTNYIIETIHLSRYLDYRDGNSEGGVTISYAIEVINLNKGLGVILHLSVAVCQKNEQFIREVGRNLSTSRLIDYMETLVPNKNCKTVFLGVGSTEYEGTQHVPIAYREGLPFVLSSKFNMLETLVNEATLLMATMHPDL